MLDLFALLAIASAAANPARFECSVPEGGITSTLQVLEASDLGDWSVLDDSARRAAGERTLKICRAPGCRDSSACLPFTGSGGIAFQRLGKFEYLPKGPSRPARVVLQGWNDADVGEQARSLGGVNVYESADSGDATLRIGTISVTEQSQVGIVDDSLLAIADFVWGKGETRYERHRFRIRVWNLRCDRSPESPRSDFRTRRKYPSLDETDTLDVIRHELSAIRSSVRIRGGR